MLKNMLTFTTKPERLEIRWGDLTDEEQVGHPNHLTSTLTLTLLYEYKPYVP